MKSIITEAPKRALKNREEISKATKCSCYSCFSVFDSKEIKNWTDQNRTAICPNCSADTVLPEELNMDTLKQIKNYWF